MSSSPRPKVYAFIDGQNLNLGTKSMGWSLDYAKFRLYLKNKFGVDRAYLFIGLVNNNQKLYTRLQSAGFILVFKPTVQYFENGKKTVKGNVDAELVLHASAVEFGNYDKAVIVTGDGDFACLIDYLKSKNKLLHIITPNHSYSKLLKPFASYILSVNNFRSSVERKKGQKNTKTGISGRSKP